MPIQPPILDARVLSDLLAQLQSQAGVDLPQWTPSSGGDAGTMLQRIFARLMEIALERMNRVPEKNLLAFLDTMGMSVLSPTAASVALTFSLLKNSPPTLIPKGTQAGTKPGGQSPTLTFETTEDFTVIPAQLASSFTMDPVWDRYADQIHAVAGNGVIPFTPFVGVERMPHVLYVGDDVLLNFSHPASSVLTFLWPSRPSTNRVQQFLGSLAFQYSTGGVLKTISAALVSVAASENQIQVTLPLPDPIDLTGTGGVGLSPAVQSRWLQAVLTIPFPDSQLAQSLVAESLTLSVSSTSSFQPDLAFNDSAPLDLTKEFYPFGQAPGVGSTFYIASQDAFAKPGSLATLSFNLTSVPAPVILWEYWDGSKWSQLPSASAVDGTHGFTQNGLISLVVPASVPSGGPTGGVAAWNNVWVRARLTGGGYRGAPSIPSFQLVTSTKLAKAASAQSSSIVIGTTTLVANGKVAQFAGPGQVIQVESDYSIVTSVSGGTLNLSPPLPNAHAAGATVNVQLTTPTSTTSQTVAQGAAQLNVTFSGPIGPGNVLLIDDSSGPEFVIVKQVQQPSATAAAGFATITLTSGCQFGHSSGVSLAVVLPMSVMGFAEDTWVDTTQEFYPLGQNPGAGDFFLMYTFGGFFASVFTGTASTTSASSAGTTTSAQAAVATPAGGGVVELAPAGSTAVASLSNAFNSGLRFNNNAVTQEFASTAIGNIGTIGTISLGGWNLYTNPFINSPQLSININITLNANFPPVGIAWEYLDANGWQPINVPDSNANKFLIDGPGSIALHLSDCAQNTVNNQKGFWVRARITSGNYGVPITYVAVDPGDPSKGYQVQSGSGNVHPPVLSNFSLEYTAMRTPPGLATQNGFLYTDQTGANAGGFAPFVPVTDLVPIRHSDPEPTFYLGFDAAFPEQPVKLWVAAAPRSFTGSVRKEISVAPSLQATLPSLRWEYFNGTAWSLLPVLDETNSLTESGAVEFLTPTDLQPLARFDANQRYWVRARSSRNDPFNTQQLDGVYLNTTTAIQAVTVGSEILGSSNGQSSQTFVFSRVPILPGQQVLVREPEAPSGIEATELDAEEGNDAVQQRLNSVTQENEIWVRWHEVENFLASEPYDRHYTLDHSSGVLTFGDGQRGMIPPIDTNNITASYQTGGGAAGNVAGGAIVQIQSKVPGAGGVSNPVAADGGADTETVAGVEDRGPQVMKHRSHAVAASDIEWLAREAAGTRVARAKCLPNVDSELMFAPGWVTLLIVPTSSDIKPSPSSELLLEVETYLASSAFVGLAQQIPARLNVIGPGYIQVTVLAEVVPQVLEEAQAVKQAVIQALAAYFHPLTGGEQGTGWEFGRPVFASKVNRLIEGVAGVDHVVALQLVPNLAQHRLVIRGSAGGNSLLPAGSSVMTPDGRKSGLMAESASTSSGELFIKGFKERDPIAKVIDLKVVSVSGTTVQVTAVDGSAFNADALGMPRGSVVMMFDGSASTRLELGILPNQPGVSSIDLETPIGAPGDNLTVFYPFPITVTSVGIDAVSLTVTGTSSQPQTSPSENPSVTTIDVAPFDVDYGIPTGTMVITPDGTRQSPLASGFTAGQTGITQVTVVDSGFVASLSPGDAVLLQAPSQTLGIEPYEPEFDFPAGSLMATLDNRVRLPLLAAIPTGETSTSIRLVDFASGDNVTFGGTSTSAVFNVATVEPVFDVVDLDANFLVYSGAHQITMVEE